MTTVSPVSTAVSGMNADRHRHHREEPRRQRNDSATPSILDVPLEDVLDAPLDEALRDAAPAPEPQAAPEGVFAASQLAERLRLLEVNLRAISAGQKPWAPPQSDLTLRDRTV